MRISDWSSDVCSSDLYRQTRTNFSSQNLSTNTSTRGKGIELEVRYVVNDWLSLIGNSAWQDVINTNIPAGGQFAFFNPADSGIAPENSFGGTVSGLIDGRNKRSEEHTSELQSLMRISYAVFCLKKQTIHHSHVANEPI